MFRLLKKILTFSLVGITMFSFQCCSLKKRIEAADKSYKRGEYYRAADLYRSVYSKINSTEKNLKGRIAFNQAECYRLLSSSKADLSYANAIRYKYPDSIIYLHYAQVLQKNGKYAEALKNYNLFLKKDTNSILAKNGILACTKLSVKKNEVTRYKIAKADNFNARNTDNFSPSFLGQDADVLFFTSSRKPKDNRIVQKNTYVTGLPLNKIFTTRKDAAGKWGKPTEINEEVIIPESEEGVCSFTTDGKTMYFTIARKVANSETGTEIMTSNRAGGSWSTPQKLKIFRDSTISVAHPAVSSDGQTLYFVSDNKLGHGGKDIWKANIEGGKCKDVVNLGPEINTPGDEMFPAVRPSGVLYFSSNGHPTYGGLDIFKATPDKNEHWTIENMGEPINSTGDDFGMTSKTNAESGFFCSNRGDAKGYLSIYSFDLPELTYIIEGKVLDDKGSPVSDATVRLVSNKGTNIKVQTKKDGSYKIKINKDMDYVMLASARGHLNQKADFTTEGLKESKTVTRDFKLSSISKPVEIENIYFEFGKWDLTPASTAGLQVLVKLLKDNPNITIELSANTDMIGNSETNKTLSEKRAKAVLDYLVAAGIDQERLTAVGNGKEKPVVVDASLSKKIAFLKENDVLDEMFIAKLKPEQQEICNQINRRTEFRVLKTTYKLY